MTRSEQVAQDISALLRARNPLLWVVTKEEARAERCLVAAAAKAGYVPRFWDAGQGVTELDGSISALGSVDLSATLDAIRQRAGGQNGAAERGVWILRDAAPWLEGVIGIQACRQVRNLTRSLPAVPRTTSQAMIVLTPRTDIPQELQGHATVVEFPLPDREEIASILDTAIKQIPEDLQDAAAPNGSRDAAIDAALGLTGLEAQACYARSLVQSRRIDPVTVGNEKRRVIAREKVLEWFEPLPGGLNDVGGLDALKTWLVQRGNAYSPAAREYGLPSPKGAMVVGISGTGKSLTAKAVATAWKVPLLRIDLGALKGKFVGESEGNLRRALAVIETVGRCVVWVDELEKALAGATQGAADGGVSSDQLGALLQWMQDRQGEAFLFATCNDVSTLPPELCRKGRWDELWFVDLPTATERAQIASTALRAAKRDPDGFDLEAVAAATSGFNGAEIASLVPDALHAGFADGAREITTADLLDAARNVYPLSKSMEKKIDALRDWAKGRTRPATTPAAAPAGAVQDTRQIDL